MADPKEHFTIVVEVSRVQPEQLVASGYNGKETTKLPRQVTEVARVVLRDDHLPTLLTRANQHLDLLQPAETNTTTPAASWPDNQNGHP